MSRRPTTSPSKPVCRRIAPRAIDSGVPGPPGGEQPGARGVLGRLGHDQRVVAEQPAGAGEPQRRRDAGAGELRRHALQGEHGGAVEPAPRVVGRPRPGRASAARPSAAARPATSSPATTRRRSIPRNRRPATSMWPPSAPSSTTDALTEQQVLGGALAPVRQQHRVPAHAGDVSPGGLRGAHVRGGRGPARLFQVTAVLVQEVGQAVGERAVELVERARSSTPSIVTRVPPTVPITRAAAPNARQRRRRPGDQERARALAEQLLLGRQARDGRAQPGRDAALGQRHRDAALGDIVRRRSAPARTAWRIAACSAFTSRGRRPGAARPRPRRAASTAPTPPATAPSRRSPARSSRPPAANPSRPARRASGSSPTRPTTGVG